MPLALHFQKRMLNPIYLCKTFQAGLVSNMNQILPYFIMDVLAYPGLPGLLFSCLFSGALSSLSSSINSMSAILWEDVLKHHYSHWSEAQKTLCNKIITICFALCCLPCSFLIPYVGKNTPFYTIHQLQYVYI